MKHLAPVGAGLLAMNDYAVRLTHRGVCIASKPAPTGFGVEGLNHG
ncbi:hypothetical protein [Pseudomonas sp. BF-R-01]|nr:hypothetical protein [Pseudomonas sp. BF-R-01]EJM78210.1 hypothetical protein PMI33_05705 [Pseudomonas sp. GM67]